MTSGFLLLLLLLVVLWIPNGHAWRSKMYPSNWHSGMMTQDGKYLQDFSYAGYYRSERGIPFPTSNDEYDATILDVTKSPYNADPTGIADATRAIQKAIDDCASKINVPSSEPNWDDKGRFCVVYFPEGLFSISSSSLTKYCILIEHDGIILRGAGYNKTYVQVTTTKLRHKDCILFRAPEGDSASWYGRKSIEAMLTHDAAGPTSTVYISKDDSKSFQVGDFVAVRTDVTTAFVADHQMTHGKVLSQGWSTDDLKGMVFARFITEKTSQSLTFDIPVRYNMLTRDKARVYRVAKPLQNCGLEHLSIGNIQNDRSGWGDNQYNDVGTGAYDVHASSLVKMEYVLNCWIQQVHSFKPKTNSHIHFLSNAIVLSKSRSVSLRFIELQSPQYLGNGGNGYGVTISAADSLFSDMLISYTRHSVSFKDMLASGNVVLRLESRSPRYSTDFHMYLSCCNLFDNTKLVNDSLQATYRPFGDKIEHGFTTTQSVFWNTQGEGDQTEGSSGYFIESRQFGPGYVIGTHCTKQCDIVTTPVRDWLKDGSPVDYVEGIQQAQTLLPQSLFESMVEKRFTKQVSAASSLSSVCVWLMIVVLVLLLS